MRRGVLAGRARIAIALGVVLDDTTAASTSRRTARSTACLRARRRPAASERSTRRAGRSRPPPTRTGRSRSRSTSTWSARSARTAGSCSWRRRRTSTRPLRVRGHRGRGSGANAISNSWAATSRATRPASDVHFNHPGVAITASSGDNGFGVEYPAASRVGDRGRRHVADDRGQRARLDRVGVERRRQRLLRLRAEAGVADRRRLRAAHRRGRLRGRRPEHRRRRLRLFGEHGGSPSAGRAPRRRSSPASTASRAMRRRSLPARSPTPTQPRCST